MTLEQRRDMLSGAFQGLLEATFQGKSAKAILSSLEALRIEISLINQEIVKQAQERSSSSLDK